MSQLHYMSEPNTIIIVRNLNLEVLWLVTKVFSTKFRGRTHFGGSIGSTSEQSMKVFSCEILIWVRVRVGVREFHQFCKSFLPRKFLKLHCMMDTHHSCLHTLRHQKHPSPSKRLRNLRWISIAMAIHMVPSFVKWWQHFRALSGGTCILVDG